MPYRTTNLMIAVLSTAMILIAWLYFQQYLGFGPCPMCINQRVFVILAGFFALVAVIDQRATMLRKITYSSLSIISIIAGLLVSGRQLWLQSLPEGSVPACGPEFNYVIAYFPWVDMLNALFLGDGNCAKVHWELLSISIPGWVFIFLLVMLIFALQAIVKEYKQH